MWAKWALGPSSSEFRSKDHGTHNTPISLAKGLCFSVRENTVFLNFECGKLKRLRELMHTLNDQ